MSFSQTELVNAMRLLSTRLPQFPEQQKPSIPHVAHRNRTFEQPL